MKPNAPEHKTDEQIAQETQEFILKLTRAPNMHRADQIQGIAQQFKRIENNRYFTDVYTGLDPDVMSAEIRALTDPQRDILRKGMKLYDSLI